MSNSAAPIDQAVSTPQARVNILIVDDEPRNLDVLETVLDDPGYRLVRANSGDEALLAIMANEFAVLVLDVSMPRMTGFELAQMVKERKKTANVPIIFLTAYYNEDQHVLAGYGSGAVDYLHKPVNAPVLRSKVAVFAELHRRGAALEVANKALMAEVAERRKAQERLGELNASLDRRVTERTEALQASERRLREADRRKDEFLATLAHELRNPLAPVRNAVHIMRGKGRPATPEMEWAADVIDRQVKSMSRLIDDLMDISRINQGRIELRQQPALLSDVLRDAVETTRPVLEEFGHELVLDLPQEELWLSVDATRLAQAFMNILNNAAKYMDAGGKVSILARRDGSEAVISIRDQGIGIAPDQLAGIFEMFSQVESALTRSRGGLGIGLSLSKRLVEMHGGRIEARSAGVGQGSEFVVRLPLVSRDVPAGTPDTEVSAGVPLAGGRKLRILVADDNVDAGETLAMLLGTLGHTARHVADGEAAVQAAAEDDPDLIVLDIGMPKLNGYEACMKIRTQPSRTRCHIVAVTGWGQPDDVARALQAGFDQHFVKPVDPGALIGLVAQLSMQ